MDIILREYIYSKWIPSLMFLVKPANVISTLYLLIIEYPMAMQI